MPAVAPVMTAVGREGSFGSGTRPESPRRHDVGKVGELARVPAVGSSGHRPVDGAPTWCGTTGVPSMSA